VRYRTIITVWSDEKPKFKSFAIAAYVTRHLGKIVGVKAIETEVDQVRVHVAADPVVIATSNYVQIRSGGKDLFYWDSNDFKEQGPAIVKSVQLFYESGPAKLRAIIAASKAKLRREYAVRKVAP
jgi:hypothetical protein